MKHIITSVGRTVFKNRSILAIRAPGLDPGQPRNIGVERQHPKNTGLDTGVMGEKAAQGTRVPPQQSSEAPKSWEQEKERIGFNADKHEMPWVAEAKKHIPSEKDFTGAKKFHGSSMAQEKTNLDQGTKSKVAQATDFVKNQSAQENKSFTDMAKETASQVKDQATELKNQAGDKLSQAAEFVKKQASVNPGDFEPKNPGETHGIFDSIKDTASHAVDWVKEKITGEHHQQQEINQSFKAGEEAKDRVASKLAPEQTISENTVRGQAQPKVDKSTKEEIGNMIDKGIKKPLEP